MNNKKIARRLLKIAKLLLASNRGMSFDDAVKRVKNNEKITYGTRTNKWHIIGKDDMDYNTSFALTKKEAEKLGEKDSKKKILSPHIW